jgi:hypothetical protein
MFLQTLAPFGLSPAAMKPGYGLAESTVYVSDEGSAVRLVDKEKLEVEGVLLDVCTPMPILQLPLMSTFGTRVVGCVGPRGMWGSCGVSWTVPERGSGVLIALPLIALPLDPSSNPVCEKRSAACVFSSLTAVQEWIGKNVAQAPTGAFCEGTCQLGGGGLCAHQCVA